MYVNNANLILEKKNRIVCSFSNFGLAIFYIYAIWIIYPKPIMISRYLLVLALITHTLIFELITCGYMLHIVLSSTKFLICLHLIL